MVVDNHKYELRLGGPGGTATLNSRPLTEEELQTFREATMSYQWIPVGWTRFTHSEIEARFRTVLGNFGTYHFIRNNCRHFLQRACRDLLHMVDDYAFFRVDILTRPAFVLIFYYIAHPMLVQRDEFFSFMFRCILGRGETRCFHS